MKRFHLKNLLSTHFTFLLSIGPGVPVEEWEIGKNHITDNIYDVIVSVAIG